MNGLKRIILIDDDVTFNFICGAIFRKVAPQLETVFFTEPKEALQYMQDTFAKAPVKTILFVDINMPDMNGWEVIDELENMNTNDMLSYLSIQVLTSSIDFRDKQKASANPHVEGFISKPLTPEHVNKLIASLTQ